MIAQIASAGTRSCHVSSSINMAAGMPVCRAAFSGIMLPSPSPSVGGTTTENALYGNEILAGSRSEVPNLLAQSSPPAIASLSRGCACRAIRIPTVNVSAGCRSQDWREQIGIHFRARIHVLPPPPPPPRPPSAFSLNLLSSESQNVQGHLQGYGRRSFGPSPSSRFHSRYRNGDLLRSRIYPFSIADHFRAGIAAADTCTGYGASRMGMSMAASASGHGYPAEDVEKAGTKPQIPSRNFNSKVARLRELLAMVPGIHQGPCCHDAISAKMVEKAGFDFAVMSGFCVSASRLGLPDAGLISYGEIVEQASLIAGAISIPVIGDGDTGYGNAMNVKRTIRGYIQAGMAGILLEDQVHPKACGHTKGRSVVSREEAVMRIRAAVDARNESGSDIVIVARSDARQAVSFEEAMWRTQAFADAGADVVFVDALGSVEEMENFCKVAPGVPKMANMLEGGGKTPICTPQELQEMGFKIVVYPLSLLGVSVRAMSNALEDLKKGQMPPPSALPSFEELKEIVGFNKYYEEEARYRTGVVIDSGLQTEEMKRGAGVTDDGVTDANGSASDSSADVSSPRYRKAADASDSEVSGVLRGDGPGSWSSREGKDGAVDAGPTEVVEGIVLVEGEGEEEQRKQKEKMTSGRSLRVKITGQNGAVKLETKVPAGFLDNLASIIPGIAGINLKKLLDDAPFDLSEPQPAGRTILDIQDGGNRVQVFLE